jgi:protein SCO1/2
MAAARADLPQYDRVLLVDSPVAITFAELMDQNGDSFDIDQLHGKVSFVLFGFTNCPDICPMVLQRMRQFQVAVNKNDSVAFVMVSVDAERDSPAAMKDYLSTYSAEFIGLTGDVASIRATAQQFSAAFFKNEPADDSGNYEWHRAARRRRCRAAGG